MYIDKLIIYIKHTALNPHIYTLCIILLPLAQISIDQD